MNNMQHLDFLVSLVDRVSGPAAGMMKTMDRVTTNVQQGYQKIGYGAAGVVGAGFAIDRLISPAVEFESVMADVAKSVDFPTPTGLLDFGNDLLEMSRHLPIAAAGLAEIAAAGGRLGLEKTQLPAFVDVTAKMATAFDLQAEQAGKYAANLSNIYKIPIPMIGGLGDAINHLSDNTAAKAGDIVDVLTRIGGTAQGFGELGLGTNQAAGLAAQMLALGIPAEQSATSINALLLKLSTIKNATPKAQQALASMGLDATQFANQINVAPQQAINSFLRSLGKLGAQDASAAVTSIFGLEHAPKITLLAKSFEQYGTTLGLVADKQLFAGSMQREFEVRASTTANQIQLLSNRWNVLLVNLGSAVLPRVIDAIGWMSALIDPVADKVARWADMFPNLTRWLGYAATGVVVLVAGISLLSIGVGLWSFISVGWVAGLALVKMALFAVALPMSGLIAGIWSLTAAMFANPIGLIVLGIIALVAAVVAAVVYWDELTAIVIAAATWWWELIGVFALVDGIIALWDKLPQWWAGFKAWLANLGIFEVLGSSLDWLIGKINLIPGINIDTGDAPAPIAAPGSGAAPPAGGGVVNQVMSASSSNSSRSVESLVVQNYGTPMSGQTLADELTFAAG